MKSEFQQLNLDLVRYSLVWEDSQALYDLLQVGQDDHLLVITSAGCNVLNTLLKNPARVIAIDLNPFQNKLLLLKMHIIQHHDYAVFYGLLGFAGPTAVTEAKQELLNTLSATDRKFWSAFFDQHPDGLLTSGKLEKYITSFYNTLDKDIQDKLQRLIGFENVEAQYDYFLNNLDTSNFKDAFIAYYSDENLQRGRDSKLLKYATEPIGPTFYRRLLKQVSTAMLSDNFHFRFFFFGLQNMPGELLPPCYRKENYGFLKQHVNKIKIAEGEAVEYLLSEPGSKVTKAALSNIFEYISQEEFDRNCQALITNPGRKLDIVFWNLLNGQGEKNKNYQDRVVFKSQNLSPYSSFYFKNIIQMQFVPQLSAISNTKLNTTKIV